MVSLMQSPRQQRTRAWLALVVTAGFMAGQVAVFAHNALVQHRVCAEHGAVEHGGDSHGTEGHAESPRDETTADGLHRAPSESEDHAECGLASAVREYASVSISATAAGDNRPANAADARPDQRIIASRALHRIAPKQSPPA